LIPASGGFPGERFRQGADEGYYVGDATDGSAEAGAEMVEGRDVAFHAGLGEAENGVAGHAALFAGGS
jgi:hypothetical protein